MTVTVGTEPTNVTIGASTVTGFNFVLFPDVDADDIVLVVPPDTYLTYERLTCEFVSGVKPFVPTTG